MAKRGCLFVFFMVGTIPDHLVDSFANYSSGKLVKAISQSSSDACIVVSNQIDSEIEHDGIRVLPAKLSCFRELLKCSSSFEKTIVISHLYRMFGYAWVASKLLKARLGFRTGGVYFGEAAIKKRGFVLRWLDRWLVMHLSDFVLSTADGTPVDLYMRRFGISQKKYVKLLNGFPEMIPTPLEQRRNQVLVVSRLSPEKGINYVINSFAKALPRLNQPHELIIVGDGSHQPVLEALVDELDISDCVTFVGKAWDVFPFYQQAKVVITGLANNPIIEGIVTGTPVIAWDLGETERLYTMFPNVFVIKYPPGGYGLISAKYGDQLIDQTAEKLVGIINDFDKLNPGPDVDYDKYGWPQRIRRELDLWMTL